MAVNKAFRADPMVSVATAKAGLTCGLTAREGVQMHGGVGMTDDTTSADT